MKNTNTTLKAMVKEANGIENACYTDVTIPSAILVQLKAENDTLFENACKKLANMTKKAFYKAFFATEIEKGLSDKDVEKHIKKLAKRAGVLDELTLEFTTVSPAPSETSANSETYKIIEKTMKEVDPEIVTIPYLVTGATDSREYRDVADEIYRIYPFKITGDELDSMHGIDERLRISSFVSGIEYFVKFIKAQAERRV